MWLVFSTRRSWGMTTAPRGEGQLKLKVKELLPFRGFLFQEAAGPMKPSGISWCSAVGWWLWLRCTHEADPGLLVPEQFLIILSQKIHSRVQNL